jgi:hypothetical protein
LHSLYIGAIYERKTLNVINKAEFFSFEVKYEEQEAGCLRCLVGTGIRQLSDLVRDHTLCDINGDWRLHHSLMPLQ